MNPVIKPLAFCLAALGLGGLVISHAETVTVDYNMSNGYMAVFALAPLGGPNYDAFQFGSNWGLPDVKSTVGTTSVVLEANYNTYANNPNPPDSLYWRDNGGAGPGGNKWMVASTFARVSASWFTDQNCNFQAQVSNYTFTAGYTVRAFIRGFSASNTNFAVFSDPLDVDSVVDLNFDTTGWVEIQYGFEVQGINANPAFPQGSATVVALNAPPVEPGIPNPGFEIPDGGKWAFEQENGHFVTYLTEGGNPGGHAEIDATGATQTYYGVLVSNGRLWLHYPHCPSPRVKNVPSRWI